MDILLAQTRVIVPKIGLKVVHANFTWFLSLRTSFVNYILSHRSLFLRTSINHNLLANGNAISSPLFISSLFVFHIGCFLRYCPHTHKKYIFYKSKSKKVTVRGKRKQKVVSVWNDEYLLSRMKKHAKKGHGNEMWGTSTPGSETDVLVPNSNHKEALVTTKKRGYNLNLKKGTQRAVITVPPFKASATKLHTNGLHRGVIAKQHSQHWRNTSTR